MTLLDYCNKIKSRNKNNMDTIKFIKEHEKLINKKPRTKKFTEIHTSALKTLRHERMIHLIVTMSVTIFDILFLGMYLSYRMMPFILISILLLVTIAFYYFHYYRLENTTQRWEEVEYKMLTGKK